MDSRSRSQTPQLITYLGVAGSLAAGFGLSPWGRLFSDSSAQPTSVSSDINLLDATEQQSSQIEVVEARQDLTPPVEQSPQLPLSSSSDMTAVQAISTNVLGLNPNIDVNSLFDQAAELRQGSWFLAAYGVLQQVPESHSSYQLAQQQMQECAALILDRANDKYLQGDIAKAVKYLKAVPLGSDAAKVAQANLPTWERQSKVLANASQMLEQEKWHSALTLLERFSDRPFFPSTEIQQKLHLAYNHLDHRPG